MSSFFKRKLIAAVTFIGGLYFFLEYVIPKTVYGFQFGAYHDQISRAVVIVGSMAIGLGVINILRVHGGAILRARKGWGNSLALLLGFFVMLSVEGLDLIESEQNTASWQEISNLVLFSKTIEKDASEASSTPDFLLPEPRLAALQGSLSRIQEETTKGSSKFSFSSPEEREQLTLALSAAKEQAQSLQIMYKSRQPIPTIRAQHRSLERGLETAIIFAKDAATLRYQQTLIKKLSHFLQHSFFFPLGAAMFSLLGFYIASAAYRSFRVRSLEALCMMLAAFLVMLGQIPHGPIYVHQDLPALRLWLLLNLSTPAFRAIFFGSAIAGLALAVRMWLSMEQSPLADSDKRAEEE